MPRLNSIADLERHRSELLAAHDADTPRVTICSGTGCHALRSDKVHEAFVDELTLGGLDGRVDLLRTGCHGFCERGLTSGWARVHAYSRRSVTWATVLLPSPALWSRGGAAC